MNSFGHTLRISIFGESHGPQIGIVIDGVPPGIALAETDLTPDIDRRRSGAPGTTPRKESDRPRIVSGLFSGHTTGAPIAILFENQNTRSEDYAAFRQQPRPSHADLTGSVKFGGYNDPRGGGHFSGRITLPLVAAGAIAKLILRNLAPQARIEAHITALGGVAVSGPEEYTAVLADAVAGLDSVGGIVECTATGLPAGLGEPFFDSAESLLGHAAFAIPGVRGIEFGSGFAAAAMRGSQHNDPIAGADGHTATNHAGGINGGITNGNPLVFRIAVKPTASIGREQQTYNFASGKTESLVVQGRHDAAIVLRVPVVAEAVTALVLADLLMRK